MNVSEPSEREDAERFVKKRVMGTMRLISELYKKDMVRDWIITTCMESLLSSKPGVKTSVTEDSIEVGAMDLLTSDESFRVMWCLTV
jgi:translation initiation factor 4G